MNSTMTTYKDICISSSSTTDAIISVISICLAISELAPFTRFKQNGILHSIYLFAKSIKIRDPNIQTTTINDSQQTSVNIQPRNQ